MCETSVTVKSFYDIVPSTSKIATWKQIFHQSRKKLKLCKPNTDNRKIFDVLTLVLLIYLLVLLTTEVSRSRVGGKLWSKAAYSRLQNKISRLAEV